MWNVHALELIYLETENLDSLKRKTIFEIFQRFSIKFSYRRIQFIIPCCCVHEIRAARLSALCNLLNSYASFVFLHFLRSLGRTGSSILRRMIIKRGRVAWTFGKRPRFVQQSALTADRNTWTRAASGWQRVWEGEVRVGGWGVGPEGAGRAWILTEAFAPCSLAAPAGAILRNDFKHRALDLSVDSPSVDFVHKR